jgi:hypothetical protein
VDISGAERWVSLQLTILKVLAGHPQGHASVADLKHYIAVLTTSGPDWSRRMMGLADRAPGLDIFSSSYVLCLPDGWQITEAGRAFLDSIEAPAALVSEDSAEVAPVGPNQTARPSNVIQLAGRKPKRRSRAA